MGKKTAPLPANCFSQYRVLLVDGGKALSTGSLAQSDLLEALAEHGKVWNLETMPQGSKFMVTFKSCEAVSALVAQSKLAVGAATFKVEGYKIQTRPGQEEEVRSRQTSAQRGV